MTKTTVTVFGGAGFLGRAIVQSLSTTGFHVRSAARHPTQRTYSDNSAGETSVIPIRADVTDEPSVAAAVKDAQAVVNAVGLYVERGPETFDAVHVHGARIVARQAAAAGVGRLIHVSGIGVSAASLSRYVRAREKGERAVKENFDGAIIVRPSALFGSNDALLTALDRLTGLAPVFPLFGTGHTRLQPVYVEDVACAIERLIEHPAPSECYELGGPRRYTFRELIEIVLAYRGRRRRLLPVPYAVWLLQARLLGVLPNPPLTVDQVELMRSDSVIGDSIPGFAALGIEPRAVEALLPECLGANSTRNAQP